MKAYTLSRLISETETVYCDHCKDEVGFEHRLYGETYCKSCYQKKRNQLEEEWNKLFDKVEAGEVDTLEGERELHRIHMDILEIEFEY